MGFPKGEAIALPLVARAVSYRVGEKYLIKQLGDIP
jgi:hypothetical protein